MIKTQQLCRLEVVLPGWLRWTQPHSLYGTCCLSFAFRYQRGTCLAKVHSRHIVEQEPRIAQVTGVTTRSYSHLRSRTRPI